ncbi:NUMOD4 domain-containing protein [Bergeyella sp. RCAD1439]|uniref:NUMOD4 domain-containing protein n=1 Tax=Bergeyella anatis TaxID=3113737 RepID=UPI002E18243E|nr:NUMOD4 domain-containing protein [Bergeyella sp. RCAD1439]
MQNDDKKDEIWKEYKIDASYVNFYRLEFSNYGRIKTFHKDRPEGHIIKGTYQAGYPIVRSRLYKKMTPRDAEKIAEIQAEIDTLNAKIKLLKDRVLSERVEKFELRAKRDELIQLRKKHNKRIENKRKIYHAVLVHKAVAELFLDAPTDPEKKFVIHKDFDKTNNHVDNLDWASREDLAKRQMQHPKMIMHEFKKQFMEDKGPVVKHSKLNENDVLLIKKRLKKGDTLRKLAHRFNVSDMQIHRIKTGENWSHVQLVEDLVDNKSGDENQ